MEKDLRTWKLEEIAAIVGGELHGPANLSIKSPAEAGHGGPEAITFAGADSFLRLAEKSGVGAVIVGPKMSSTKPFIRVANPKQAFGEFLAHCVRHLPIGLGVHETAVVDPRAHIDPSASIGAYVVVERDAFIGPGCKIYPFCYVGDHCRLESEVVLFPHVVLYQDVVLGSRSVVHSGTILGADGFSYAWDGWKQAKVPQVGRVTIGPDCEIGALTAIDRAMLGETKLGQGVKLDNFVQIAHNVTVGDHTVMASQTGIGGSSHIGALNAFGGQVGVSDHVSLGDGIQLAARAAVTEDLTEPGLYLGYPIAKIGLAQRILILIRRLPEMARTIKTLERRIEELESKSQ